MSVNLRRDANTIIDLNADTLDEKHLYEIIKKTNFTYKDTTKTLTVVGTPFCINIVDSVTNEVVYADVEINGNNVIVQTSQVPTNTLNITVISTLL